jgi:aspartate/methionine/tyrosine aminotransferase
MTYIASRMQTIQPSALRRILAAAPAHAINLALGEIQYKSSETLIHEAKQILQTNPMRYTENAGLAEAREAVANYYENRIQKCSVCLTNGTQEALFAVLYTILNKNDEILIANPTFLAYKTMIEMAGGKAVQFQLNPAVHFALDEVSLTNAITKKSKAILLCNPSNPIGISFSEQELEVIVTIAKKNKLLIIADEIYRELYSLKREKSLLDLSEHSIVVSGLSKSHALTGWRIGWIASSISGLVKKMTTAHQYICTSAPTLSQKIIPFALSPKGMNYATEIRTYLKENRDLTLHILQNSNWEIQYPTHTPYLFINVKTDDVKFAENLSKKGILVVPGSVFGTNGKGFIRINYGVQKEELVNALEFFKNSSINC